MTKPPKAEALERLQKALDEIHQLKQLPGFSPQFKRWYRNTGIAIAYTFGEEGRQVEDFKRIYYAPRMEVVGKTHVSKAQQFYERGLESAASVLESMIDEIKVYWEEDRKQVPTFSNIQRDELINTNKVFVVHGRDHETKLKVVRLLEKLELETVILEEQTNEGRTIIAKFEQEAQEVSFAVVLLTPDDEGRLQGEEAEPKPRARQNVILELGYFIGHLGRNRVCVLTTGDVDRPTDYDGVMYILLDATVSWEIDLMKELHAAGFDVDANRVL